MVRYLCLEFQKGFQLFVDIFWCVALACVYVAQRQGITPQDPGTFLKAEEKSRVGN